MLSEQRQYRLRCLVRDGERLDTQLLLHLKSLQASGCFFHIRINDGADAHTAKGVAGNIGANELHAAAEKVDIACKEQDAAAVDQALPALEEATQRVIASLSVLDASSSPKETGKPAEQVDPQALLQAVSGIEALLQNNSFTVLKELESLQPKFEGTAFAGAFAEMLRFAEQYDFDDALAALVSLKAELEADG